MREYIMKNVQNLSLDLSIKSEIFNFFDEETNTFSYIVKDPNSNSCAVIDSVMDIDYASATISYNNAEKIIAYINNHHLHLEWILETHVHADHLSAASYLQENLGGKIGIGSNITQVQKTFDVVFNEGTEFQRDGSQFDCLFDDGDSFQIGGMKAYVIHTPGHTPACIAFIIGDSTFVGDTLFMPDIGTARVDFPGGDASTLYQSIQKLLSLPSEMRLFMCHDYPPISRKMKCQTTVANERKLNIHINDGITESEFVELRQKKDLTLGMPKLILPSLQVNMRGGRLPHRENNNRIFLKIPVNIFSD
jgi:glyoxylase-like metal-dependent hydrolase (beta-lactamase superfamily II)